MNQSSRGAFGKSALVGIVALMTGVTGAPLLAQSGHALGVDTTNFDRSVRPQDDFFRFVNGGWLARTEIPSDASSWGVFNDLGEKSRADLHGIIEEAAKSNAPAGSDTRKVGDLYASYMDSALVESLGLRPLESELHRVSALKTTTDLPAEFAHLARMGVQGPFGVRVGADQKQSRVNIASVNQSGIGMPDRDYYLAKSAKMEETREAYRNYIARLLTLANVADASNAASRVMALETAIATVQWDRAHNRDRNATYNKMTVAQLTALTPSYNWHTYMTSAGLGSATDVVVRQPSYVKAMNDVVGSTPIATWREYLTFKLLDEYANELPAAFRQTRFAFRDSTLSGLQTQRVQWKRGVAEVERVLGDPTGKLYVARYFKPEAKARMDAMVNNLRLAYKVGIDSLEWMSPATKTQAKEKLSKFTVKIGYPDRWRDYSTLVIKRDDLLGNVQRYSEFQYNDMASQLGKPVERWRWGMTPQTVNAYYNATGNEIVFPAAILQPPFFDVNSDDATNYGAIGAVIGHEIGHGFDDQGRKSDGDGNLRDWWTPADAKAFEARTTRLAAQYDAINPIDSLHINGQLTMGENIGDLSGLAQAYRAYHISLHGRPAPVIDGFTGDQRFFLGFAQIWRTKFRDAALRQQLLSNPHSPGMYRAYVPLINNDAFDKAFDVKPGDKMYLAPADRVKIW